MFAEGRSKIRLAQMGVDLPNDGNLPGNGHSGARTFQKSDLIVVFYQNWLEIKLFLVQ